MSDPDRIARLVAATLDPEPQLGPDTPLVLRIAQMWATCAKDVIRNMPDDVLIKELY